MSNSTTGCAVTYAGGGGGASYTTAGTGTNGGGTGAKGNGGPAATAGLDGLGGGGGGYGSYPTGGKGGNGKVVLKVPYANYSGNVEGSPTVTNDGSYYYLVFTATSGAYTA